MNCRRHRFLAALLPALLLGPCALRQAACRAPSPPRPEPAALRVTDSRGVNPAYSVCIAEGRDLAVWGSTNATFVLDLADPAQPRPVGTLATRGAAWDLACRDDRLHVALGPAGLECWSIADPARPEFLGRLEPGGWARGIALSGEYLLVADVDSGLRVVDPAGPDLVATLRLPGTAYAVVASGGLAYVAAGDSGLRVVDVSDPARPVAIGHCPLPGTATGLHLWAGPPGGDSGPGYVLVAAGDSGLRVVLLPDRASGPNPVEVGFLATPGRAYGLTASGQLAYLAAWDSGLRIIDLSDPARPVEIGAQEGVRRAYAVGFRGGQVLLAAWDHGLRVVDVRDPAAPSAPGRPVAGR